MKTALSSLTGVLYNYPNQEVVELYTIDMGSFGVRYLTTNKEPILSGSTVFAPGGEYVSSSIDFTGVTTYTTPTVSASWSNNGDLGSINISNVSASAGQTLIAIVSNADSTWTSTPTNTIGWGSGGGGNVWSSALMTTTGPVGGIRGDHYRLSLFTCSVGTTFSNATVSAGNNYSMGALAVYVFNGVGTSIIGLTGSRTGTVGASSQVSMSLGATAFSSTYVFAFHGNGTTAQAALTNNTNDFSYSDTYSRVTFGRFTGSVTSSQTSILGESTSLYEWGMLGLEVKASSSSEGSWVTNYIAYNNPAVERGGSRTPVGTEVSSMDLTIYPGPNTLGGLSMSLAAAQGAFDSAHVKVQRRYINSSGTIYTTLFEGDVVDVKPASTQIGLTVKSGMARLELPFPPRVIQAQCSWQLYDTNCGVASASFTIAGTTGAGSTKTLVSSNAANMTVNAYRGGLLTFTSGPLAGVTRTVNSNTVGDLVIYPVLPSIPGTGITYTVKRGCDKTRTACKTVFNNLVKFGGFADVPAPEKK